jgi:hypothetical protein
VKEDLLRFIDAVDAKIDFPVPVDIYLVGGAALLLAYNSTYGTKDIDLIGREGDANLRRLAALFPERAAIASDRVLGGPTQRSLSALSHLAFILSAIAV